MSTKRISDLQQKEASSQPCSSNETSQLIPSTYVQLIQQASKKERAEATTPIYYDVLRWHSFQLLVAANEEAILSIDFIDTEKDIALLLNQHFPSSTHVEKHTPLHTATLTALTKPEELKTPLPVMVQGTAFQVSVWQALLQIPAGTTLTYAALSTRIGHPRAYRAVGSAVGQNFIAVLIPCHRIVPATGTKMQYKWGANTKRMLLEMEAELQ